MKIRITNSAELDPDTVASVVETSTGLRVVFKGGVVGTFPRQRLTQEGREALEPLAQETV